MDTVAKGAVAESKELRLKISGMHCKACVEHVTQVLKKLDGVKAVSVSFVLPEAVLKTVRRLSLSEINHALAQVGEYQASEHFGDSSPAPMFQIELPVSAAAMAPQVSQHGFWQDVSTWRRASLNTLNCLVGCSIGDFGFIIYAQATALAWSMWAIMGVAMLCGLSTSVLMETLLLKWRENFGWKMAVRTAFSMSFLSMLAMELAENVTDYMLTRGEVAPSEPFFWIALVISLLAGFLVPLPYNYFKLRKYNKACH